jgi:aspartyl-tRNA(Asn)/glutamyl-tRNA(Gln) amidotransferase subunit C
MLSKKEVKHIAKLARLGLSGAEIEKFQKELSLILDYVEKIKKISVLEKKEASSCSGDFLDIKSATREDKAHFNGQAEKLLKLAPQTEKGFLKTKPIIKK